MLLWMENANNSALVGSVGRNGGQLKDMDPDPVRAVLRCRRLHGGFEACVHYKRTTAYFARPSVLIVSEVHLCRS